MINTNKRWLLTASPWSSSRLSLLTIRGLFLIALFVLGSQASFAKAGLPAITGQTTICPTTTTTLSNTVTGGTWSTSNSAIATVDPVTGVVTGVTGGYVFITYTVGPNTISIIVTVTFPIVGGSSVCTGNNLNLTDATPTGLWASSNTAVATVTNTGMVKGVNPGTVNITYGRVGACTVSQSVTVSANSLADIDGTGPLYVCLGGTNTATNATAGGAWSSSTPSIAIIDPTTGVINGVAAGTALITYSQGGCYKTKPCVVTAPGAIAPIVGATNVCSGNNTFFTDATTLGTWSSNNTAVATVGTDGKVSGITAGTTTINYSKSGCSVSKSITVDANTIAGILGNTNVCIGQTSTLTDATTGGTWTSSNTAVATVAGGVVTGVAAGTATITYTVGGCFKTVGITVNPSSSVGAITGSSGVCKGATTSLTDAVPGGAWSTSDPTIATVNAFGLVTGVAAGNVNISYTRLGCSVAQAMTVNPLPNAITGTASVCAGLTTTLSTTSTGGSWSTSNSAIATVSSGGVVTGVAAGNVTISYTFGTGCYVTKTVTVNGPAAISGGSNACVGPFMYLYLSDPTTGGTWSSSNTAVGTVNATTGAVSGVSAGTINITYTVSGCYVTKPVTVNVAPGPISGNSGVCVASSITLTDTSTAGTWTSNNTAIATVGAGTGLVTGVTAGGVVITYTKNTCSVTKNITVAAPPAAITGLGSVCTNLAQITLTDVTPGGSWSTTSTLVSVATSGSATALITGLSTGTATVSYTIGACSVTKNVTVVANSVTSLTGTPVACTGYASTLASTTTGGVWTSGNVAIATVGTSGVVTGVAEGNTVITYTKPSDGCFRTMVFAVHKSPVAISGAYEVCKGATTTLTDASAGGSWTSGNTDLAIVSSAGVVTGRAVGLVTITYTLPGGCETYQPINVRITPGSIGGASAVCVGSVTTLTNTLVGGTWTSNNSGIASVSSTGDVTGVSAGSTTITYTAGICYVTKAITVGSVNPTITSSAVSVCANGMPSKNLTVSNGGGAWTSSSNAIATVASNGTTAGRVTGIAAGTATITYTLNGCYTTQVATVNTNTMPGITGNTEACVGSTTTLANTTGGGIWSSSNTTVATIGSGTGVVTGAGAGSTIITYGVDSGGCRQFLSMNIGNITPAAITVTTVNPLCTGATTTYTDATAGGTWSISDPTVATINSLGTIYGVNAGVANITYTLVGCYPTPVTITINAVPAAITGNGNVCIGSTTALSDATGGGTWTSSAVTKATVDATGVVTGVATSSATISYTVAGCSATKSVAIGATPAAITGPTNVCAGSTITLANTVAGGTWTCSDMSIAEISGTSLTGVLGGVVTVTYTTPGCTPVTYLDTVNYVAPIYGTSYSVCKTDSMVLTDATGGGTWSKAADTIANLSVNPGWILGAGAGTTIITYTVGNCNVTQQIFVNGCGHKPVAMPATVENQVYTIFPNPSNGSITIAQSVVADGTMEVSVMNYVGAKVYSGTLEFAGGKADLNVSAVPGMYIVLMQDKKGNTQSFKMLIEK